MSGDSEEKTLDPTDHKLQKARKKPMGGPVFRLDGW